MLDKLKNLMEMQKKMQDIKRALDATTFDVESADRLVRVTMNGSQEVKKISIQGSVTDGNKAVLENALVDGFNRAVKRSQSVAADKMKEATGLNIPGLA